MNTHARHRFGERLRKVREKKGITLKAIAEKIGVSESLLSQIERNRVSPSIDTLFSIADALDIDYEYLFRDLHRKRKVRIVRKKDARFVETSGVRYTQLSVVEDFSEKHAIEAFIIEIDSESERGSTDYGHPGMEFGFILEGCGELHYGQEVHQLRKGDSVSFASDTPHVIRNTGRSIFKALWIITPPKMVFFNS